MPAYKDNERGTWLVRFYYQDWKGDRKSKCKRGFKTKSEALTWEREFLQKIDFDLEMTFSSLVDIYLEDIKPRIKYNTYLTKKQIIDKKVLPYFASKKVNEIRPSDVIKWQNELTIFKQENGKKYSKTYLRTIQNQFNAIMNYCVKIHNLSKNPAHSVDKMGKSKAKEMEFWTHDEYREFVKHIADKPMSYIAFEILFYAGLRIGELLSLTAEDIDFEKKTMRINKSYQRLEGKDYITDPKTEKSNRVIDLPQFLCDEIKEYTDSLYGYLPTDRLFLITKSYLHKEMDRGSKLSGIKRIRLHDLRHSSVAYLIYLGFDVLQVAQRTGHEAITITFDYAHLYPSKQKAMADKLDLERRKELENTNEKD